MEILIWCVKSHTNPQPITTVLCSTRVFLFIFICWLINKTPSLFEIAQYNWSGHGNTGLVKDYLLLKKQNILVIDQHPFSDALLSHISTRYEHETLKHQNKAFQPQPATGAARLCEKAWSHQQLPTKLINWSDPRERKVKRKTTSKKTPQNYHNTNLNSFFPRAC